MNDTYLSVIIPAYNEEKTIVDTTHKVLDYLKKQNFTYEIVIGDDGSKDKTVEIARKEFVNEPSVKIVERNENHGKGFNVRDTILKSNGKIRLFMDADNATDISHFDLMKPLFDSGYDVVIGSRDGKDAKGAKKIVSQPWYKTIMGNAGNLFIQVLAVPGIWDTQCGFKAFTAEAAENIFKYAKVDRWAFDIEVLAIARMFEYKIGIIPVQWINNPNSRVKLLAYFKFLLETVKISNYVRSLKKEIKKEAVAHA